MQPFQLTPECHTNIDIFNVCLSGFFYSSFKKTHLLLYLISLFSKAHAKHNVSYEITMETNLERFFFCELA